MKIAITSFIKSENYGALLQSYALQHVIEENGHDVIYLDYERKHSFTILQYIKNRGYLFARLFFGYNTRKKRTHLFIRNFIRVEKFTNEEDYDLFVSGSDQVWHPDYVNDFFLLNFVHKKNKISYASSFGVPHIDESLKHYYKDSLSKYSTITVREETGKNILNSIGIKCSDVVVDPTLLLPQEEWEKHIQNHSLPRKKYILCYIMNGDSIMAKYIKSLASKLNSSLGGGYSIIFIGDKEYKKLIPGYNLMCTAGPLEFISFVKHADYVITSSFHGTCFSIIFNKIFISVMRESNMVNCRIEELLNLLNLQKAMHYTRESPSLVSFPEIDYNKVNESLRYQRERCLQELIKNLGIK